MIFAARENHLARLRRAELLMMGGSCKEER